MMKEREKAIHNNYWLPLRFRNETGHWFWVLKKMGFKL